MSEYVTVTVACARDGHPEETIYVFAFPPGAREPRGFPDAGRLLAAGQLVPRSESHVVGDVLKVAREERLLPVVDHQLRCGTCGFTERISDHDLQRVLRAVGESGQSSVPLSTLRRMVRLVD